MWNDLWRPSRVEYDFVLMCVFWPGQTAADWDAVGAWTGQWMQSRAVNRLQIMSPAWGSLTFIPAQTQSTRTVSASSHQSKKLRTLHLLHMNLSCKLQCQNLHISMENIFDSKWRTINGGQLLLINLYSHNSWVSSNVPEVTLIMCVLYTGTLVWH